MLSQNHELHAQELRNEIARLNQELSKAQSENIKSLAESEEKFAIAFKLNPNAMAISTMEEGKIIDANEAFLNIFGWSREEIIGKPSSALNFLRDPNQRSAIVLKLKSEGRLVNHEFKLLTRTGSEVDVLLSVEPLNTNRSELILSTLQDITEQRKLETTLRQSEERYRQLVQSANSIIIRWDTKGILSFVNNYTLQFFGYTSNEMIGKNVMMIVPEIEENGRDLSRIIQDIVENPSKYSQFENENICKDGTRVWVSWSNTAITDELGNVKEILAIGNDITDKKKAEDELRKSITEIEAILSCIPDGVLVYDKSAKIVRSNLASERILKYTEHDKKNDVSQRVKDNFIIFSEDGRELALEELPAYRSAIKGEIVTNQVLNVERDGVPQWLIFNAAPLFVSGKQFGAVLSMFDITSRKATEQLLVKAKEKAEESDRFKSMFIANISHEIRTPMSGILGFADLLKDPDISPDTQKTYVDAIISSGNRMLNIINDLINISKIEAGQIETHTEPTNINQLIDELFHFFLPEAQKRTLTLKLSKNVPIDQVWIETDKTKLSQILTNLIKNALKFTASGYVEIGCSLKNNTCEFYVKDTGAGIKRDYYDKIFERFNQGELKYSTVQEGVGLGLAISKAYLTLLGGQIWVAPNSTKGSIFYFSIPYKKAILPTPVMEVKANQSFTAIPDSEILIAEDEELIYFFLNEILSKVKIKSCHAKNGLEAVEYVKSNPYIKLILMDGRMPVMSGLEAVKQIKSLRPELPIITLSALAEDTDIENALNAGCVDYITKPIDKNILLSKIKNYLNT